jgi:hypothetical protein
VALAVASRPHPTTSSASASATTCYLASAAALSKFNWSAPPAPGDRGLHAIRHSGRAHRPNYIHGQFGGIFLPPRCPRPPRPRGARGGGRALCSRALPLLSFRVGLSRAPCLAPAARCAPLAPAILPALPPLQHPETHKQQQAALDPARSYSHTVATATKNPRPSRFRRLCTGLPSRFRRTDRNAMCHYHP